MPVFIPQLPITIQSRIAMLLPDRQPSNMLNHRVAKMIMCISQTSSVIQSRPGSSRILNQPILQDPQSFKQQIMQVCLL